MQEDTAGGWRLHPAAQITVWICLTVLAQAMHGIVLMVFCLVLLALAVRVCASRLFTLLRRTRLIFISLLLIYGFATPGESCWTQLGWFSPSCEGLTDGVMQLTRLLSVLAGLAVLLTWLSITQLISGLYTLAYPLHYLGMSREKLVVRLALTLGYADLAMKDTAKDWRVSIASLIKPVQPDSESIELQLLPFMPRDWLVIILAGAVVVGVMW